jgi:uncharacterized protein
MIKRDAYLQKLIDRKENGAIKVVTGIRRSGKSFLLFDIYRDHLLDEGVSADNIILIDLDSDTFEHLRDRKLLREHIESKIVNDNTHYLVIDEIQLCEGFEALLNGLNRNRKLDIYVTGSNSKFLSSDVITEFRGRGDEIRVRPLSFSEFYQVAGTDFAEAWKAYYTYGGLPMILSKKRDEEKAAYLDQLLHYTYLKDIVERNNLGRDEVMETLMRVLASSIGSLNNPKKISDTFRSKGTKTTDVTIKKYIDHLTEAFIISKAERYDVKGRKYISTPSKHYYTDIGLRNALLNFRQQEENHIMENIIYNELLYRGFRVDVGLVGARESVGGKMTYKQLEVDFICHKGHDKIYIQSAYMMPDEEKRNQEERPLLMIDDSFKKVIIVREDIKAWRNENGTLIMGLKDFLLDTNGLEP